MTPSPAPALASTAAPTPEPRTAPVPTRMELRLMTPDEVLLETRVTKVVAEASSGSFCLLPRHVDIASILAPGLLVYEDDDGVESFAALDEGVLVKCGTEVMVSVLNAALSPNLGELQRIITEQFRAMDEREREVRTTLAKLEHDFVRRFLQLGGLHGDE